MEDSPISVRIPIGSRRLDWKPDGYSLERGFDSRKIVFSSQLSTLCETLCTLVRCFPMHWLSNSPKKSFRGQANIAPDKWLIFKRLSTLNTRCMVVIYDSSLDGLKSLPVCVFLYLAKRSINVPGAQLRISSWSDYGIHLRAHHAIRKKKILFLLLD